MFTNPAHGEINQHTGKLVVGVIALTLANLTAFFSDTPLQSISASYHEGGWARDIFVGFLYAIFGFLLSYNGHTKFQMFLSKAAAFAAIGVAMFPCQCETHQEIIPGVHALSAAAMFIILAFFCFTFYKRAWSKPHMQARVRAIIYIACGIIIIACILVLLIDHLIGGAISSRITRLTFYGERAGLIAFGVAWLTASRFVPVLTRSDERYSIFKDPVKA